MGSTISDVPIYDCSSRMALRLWNLFVRYAVRLFRLYGRVWILVGACVRLLATMMVFYCNSNMSTNYLHAQYDSVEISSIADVNAYARLFVHRPAAWCLAGGARAVECLACEWLDLLGMVCAEFRHNDVTLWRACED